MRSHRAPGLGIWVSFLIAFLLIWTVSGITPSSSRAQSALEFVPGEILVQFRPGTSAQAISETHGRLGGRVAEMIPGIGVHVVRVPAGQELARVSAYQRHPLVLSAEVNGAYHAIFTPNDPRVGDQWQYNNTGQAGGTPDADIDAFEAWDTMGSSTIAIAILDTGIDQSHEDLKAKIAKNKNFTNSRTVDDRYGHGTHVAGSAAAITNNAVGVAGTCPNCVLYNVKVLSDNGSGSWSWIANGIIWAADNGAKVISMSLGGYSGSSTVESAVNYAWNKGAVLTAAAGNDGVSTPLYPAFYTNVIAVAATDRNDAKPSWSNFGNWVDVAAPGVAILSTAPDHNNRIWGSGVKYGTISGTSMATPHVAGVAGLVWATGVCASNLCVRNTIESNADDIPGTGTLWVSGRVNACRAVGGPCSPKTTARTRLAVARMKS